MNEFDARQFEEISAVYHGQPLPKRRKKKKPVQEELPQEPIVPYEHIKLPEPVQQTLDVDEYFEDMKASRRRFLENMGKPTDAERGAAFINLVATGTYIHRLVNGLLD